MVSPSPIGGDTRAANKGVKGATLRGLAGTATEISLAMLACKLKRAMNAREPVPLLRRRRGT